MNEDMVSIIIPTYNVAKYIRRCIDSVLNQTYDNIEIIIVDDNSSDETYSICEQYAQNNKNINLFKNNKTNNGPSAVRNIGLQKMNGGYVCFLDSDDYLENNFVEEMHNSIIQNNSQVAISGYKIENAYGKIFHKYSVNSFDSIGGYTIFNQRNWCVWGKMYKKTIFAHMCFNESLIIGEDLDITWRIYNYIIDNDFYVSYCESTYYRYCMNPNSVSHVVFNKNKLKVLDILLKIRASFTDKNLDMKESFNKILVTFLQGYLVRLCIKKDIVDNDITKISQYIKVYIDLKKENIINKSNDNLDNIDVYAKVDNVIGFIRKEYQKYIYLLKEFSLTNEHIYIYGDGQFGIELYDLLYSFGGNYEAFVVTKSNNYNTNIISIDAINPNDKGVGIILAMTEKNNKEVYKDLLKRGFSPISIFDGNFLGMHI